MKMKRVASLMLASVLAVGSLAACGNDSGSEGGESASSDTFKIGGIGPTTGDAAAYGIAVQNCAQLAVDEINADGGINGKQIEFKFEDDQNDSVLEITCRRERGRVAANRFHWEALST